MQTHPDGARECEERAADRTNDIRTRRFEICASLWQASIVGNPEIVTPEKILSQAQARKYMPKGLSYDDKILYQLCLKGKGYLGQPFIGTRKAEELKEIQVKTPQMMTEILNYGRARVADTAQS